MYRNLQALKDFETSIVYVATDEYRNLNNAENIYWPRIAALETGGGATKIVEWNWATAELHKLGPDGAQTKFDTIVAQQQEMGNDYFGTGLKITGRQWDDDEIDRAAPWAAGAGQLMAYAPQAFLDSIINNGESITGNAYFNAIQTWEGKPLFATDHAYSSRDDSTTFSNLHEGMPFNETNLAKAVAYIEGLLNSGGQVNYNRPRQLMVGSNFRLRSGQITKAEYFTDTLRATANAAASAQNMFASQIYNFDEPIVSPTINSGGTEGAWYLVVPIEGRAFNGPVRLWEREPFAIRSFNPNDNWTLQQLQEFVWRLQGRWGAAAGDPMQIHKFTADGTPESWVAAMTL